MSRHPKFLLSSLGLSLLGALMAASTFALEARAPETAEAWVVPAEMRELGTPLAAEDSRWLDYGARQILPLSASALSSLRPEGARRVPYTARLGGELVDLRQWVPARRADAWRRPADVDDQLSLLQFVSPPRAAWIRDLEAAGLQVVRVIQPYLVVVWGDVTSARAPAVEPYLRHVGRFEPEFRLAPALRSLEPAMIDARLLVVRYATESVVRSALRQRGASVTGWKPLDRSLVSVTVRVDAARLPEIAGSPGVYSVRIPPTDGGLRGEMSNQVHVGNVDGTGLAFPGYQSWLSTLGLDGNGVTIANVDGGVDETHPDLVGRMVSCTGTTCSSSSSSHGTHTAGIMAGDGASGTGNGDGFLRGLGVAPGAQLFEQRYSPFFTQAGGMLLLMQDSFVNGAPLSGNSWGPAGSPQGYDDDTMQVDIGVRDADPATAGNQQFTYVLSFMNGGGGTSSQGSPDEAKNLINVGSTRMQSSSTTQYLDIDNLSANTAHGPALDGRTIPHLVAPGCSVDSTDTNGSGYGLKCGTSMASPHVSGTVALLIQKFRGDHGTEPSPALIKAAILANARSLAGNEDADGGTLGQPFDNKQGWGRDDPAALLSSSTEARFHDQQQIFDDTGQVWEETWQIADPSQPVRLMLVWTDAPGHGLGGSTPAWNNDLDLEVDDGPSTYLGNRFGSEGWSTSGGTADGMNNTEGVFLTAAARSEVTVRVIASDVTSDGIPGNSSLTDQDFALWCTNCVTFSAAVFADGFESGDTESWSLILP